MTCSPFEQVRDAIAANIKHTSYIAVRRAGSYPEAGAGCAVRRPAPAGLGSTTAESPHKGGEAGFFGRRVIDPPFAVVTAHTTSICFTTTAALCRSRRQNVRTILLFVVWRSDTSATVQGRSACRLVTLSRRQV